jgi:hypothetical protein
MRLTRFLPAALGAAAGIVLLVAAACGGGGGSDPASSTEAAATAAEATPTNSPTQRPTNTPTVPPTPTPYNGAVKRFKIAKFGVDAPIEELAINARGELDTPKAENTGVAWYYIYDKPGRTNPDNRGWVDIGGQKELPKKGNAVFSAHVYYHSIPAPFQRLAQAKEGDEIRVTMEDGREYVYKVISNKRYHRDTIPMENILWPKEKPAEKEWLTAITCGGELDSTGQEYVSRDVIVAERVE